MFGQKNGKVHRLLTDIRTRIDYNEGILEAMGRPGGFSERQVIEAFTNNDRLNKQAVEKLIEVSSRIHDLIDQEL